MANKDLELALRIKADLVQAKQQIEQLASGMEGLDNSSASLNKTFGTTSSATASVVQDLNRASLAAENAGKTFVYAGQSSFSLRDGLYASSNQAKISADIVTRLLNTYDAQAIATTKLTNDERLLASARQQGRITAEQYSRSLLALRSSNQQLGNSYGSARGLAQNFGWQLQDIAVQAQMGVNPTTILSQQGSQLISVFNPLAGAAIAVGGALAGVLLPSLFSNSDAVGELSKKIRELNEDYKNLNVDQKNALINEQEQIQVNLKKDVEEKSKEIEKLTKRYESLIAARDGANSAGISTSMGLGSGPGSGYVTGSVEKAETELENSRAALVTLNQQLAKSEQEIIKIRTGEDKEKDAAAAKLLVEKLEEEVATYGLAGEELGKYIAAKIHATGANEEKIRTLYAEIQAQKDKTKADNEATAEEERKRRQAENTARSNETYVKSLEAQAAALRLNSSQVAEAEFVERGLTNTLLERARAAQQVIIADKERGALAQLQQQLFRSQGENLQPTFDEFRSQFKNLLDQLGEDSKQQGEEIVKNLFGLNALQNQLREAESAVEKTLAEMQRQETSINTQREAGLITQAEAQRRIVELHQQTYEKLQAQRGVLEELSEKGGAVGEAAKTALAEMDAQAQLLEATLDRLEATLRSGLESGLTDALSGLAKGTYTLREAIGALGQTVLDALIQMAAQDIAQSITTGLFGGGDDAAAKNSEAATKTTIAAGALTAAAATWAIVAAQIEVAAFALAASGGGGGGSAGGSSGGQYAGYANMIASVFAADGGHIVGPGTATSDSIPAMLSNNEFVTRAAVVNQPGALDFLHSFNRFGMSVIKHFSPAYHNTGGLAGVPAPAMPTPSMPASASDPSVDKGGGDVRFTSINVVDPELVQDYLQSTKGDQVFINWIKRNTSTSQRLLGIKG